MTNPLALDRGVFLSLFDGRLTIIKKSRGCWLELDLERLDEQLSA